MIRRVAAHGLRIHLTSFTAYGYSTGYHKRSLGEAAMFRLKTIFGAGASSRKDPQRATEVGVRCRALNIMTHQGRPVTVRVA